MALAAYRHVLRSTRIAFQGDSRILSAARLEARSRFDSNRSLGPDSIESNEQIEEAEEIARILKQNIVQGEQTEGTGTGNHKYQLRIHKHIERGDNDSIKAGKMFTAAEGSCCGGAS